MSPSFFDSPLSVPSPMFPGGASIEGVSVLGFETTEAFFRRILHEVNKPYQVVVSYLNIHVANTAVLNSKLKRFLQEEAEFIYCDGAGIQLGASLQSQTLPMRFPAADWFIDFVRYFARKQKNIFLLGGQPGVSEQMYQLLEEKVTNHTVIGHHHGYILNDPKAEAQLIERINQLRPDILIVGLGTPIQEEWIQKNRSQLDVSFIFPLGAVMDYFTGETHRCPKWVGDFGFEWLYRLSLEPRRMAGRYLIGNPWFVSRILVTRLTQAFSFTKQPLRKSTM